MKAQRTELRTNGDRIESRSVDAGGGARTNVDCKPKGGDQVGRSQKNGMNDRNPRSRGWVKRKGLKSVDKIYTYADANGRGDGCLVSSVYWLPYILVGGE